MGVLPFSHRSSSHSTAASPGPAASIHGKADAEAAAAAPHDVRKAIVVAPRLAVHFCAAPCHVLRPFLPRFCWLLLLAGLQPSQPTDASSAPVSTAQPRPPKVPACALRRRNQVSTADINRHIAAGVARLLLPVKEWVCGGGLRWQAGRQAGRQAGQAGQAGQAVGGQEGACTPESSGEYSGLAWPFT